MLASTSMLAWGVWFCSTLCPAVLTMSVAVACSSSRHLLRCGMWLCALLVRILAVACISTSLDLFWSTCKCMTRQQVMAVVCPFPRVISTCQTLRLPLAKIRSILLIQCAWTLRTMSEQVGGVDDSKVAPMLIISATLRGALPSALLTMVEITTAAVAINHLCPSLMSRSWRAALTLRQCRYNLRACPRPP